MVESTSNSLANVINAAGFLLSCGVLASELYLDIFTDEYSGLNEQSIQHRRFYVNSAVLLALYTALALLIINYDIIFPPRPLTTENHEQQDVCEAQNVPEPQRVDLQQLWDEPETTENQEHPDTHEA
jgi:hypothetical protein